jgi:hypothetical protein
LVADSYSFVMVVYTALPGSTVGDVFVAERCSMFVSGRLPCTGRSCPFTGLDTGCGVDEMPVGR